VNSAGNNGWEGPGSIGTPADADSMLAIGAVDSLNVLASFSSRGPSDDGRTKPEVVARGDVTWWADASAPDAYGYASGTSLSCPLVGGAATLIAEAHPEWSNMQIRDALMATADRHTHPDNDYGWGRINVQAAIATAPVVYPVPFDLVAPADGALLTNLQPRYTWRATNDPDEGGTLSYAVLLWESQIGGLSWRLEAGGDTTLVQPFPLSPGRSYTWEVVAEDQDGYRRLSREARGFTTPSGSAAPEPVRAAAGLRLSAGPNPFTAEVRARLEGAPAGPIRWAVYDPIGRRVAAGQLAGADGAGGKAGSGSTAGFTWDGRDGQGEPAPAGVYFLEASAGYAHARTMVVKLAR